LTNHFIGTEKRGSFSYSISTTKQKSFNLFENSTLIKIHKNPNKEASYLVHGLIIQGEGSPNPSGYRKDWFGSLKLHSEAMNMHPTLSFFVIVIVAGTKSFHQAKTPNILRERVQEPTLKNLLISFKEENANSQNPKRN